VAPIRGLLTKAGKGARYVVLGCSKNPWLLPAGAIMVVAIADIGFGKAGAFLALGAIALALAGFGAGILSSGAARPPVTPTAGSLRPAGNAQAGASADGVDSTDADTTAGTNTNAIDGTGGPVGGGADATAGTRTDLSFAQLTMATLTAQSCAARICALPCCAAPTCGEPT
jgi:hypothetical protein